MSLDIRQFKEVLVRPALQAIGLWSESAENLIVGTGIIESGLVYLQQLPNGPAVSIFQMESPTYLYLKQRLNSYPELLCKIKEYLFISQIPSNYEWLIGNLNAAVIFCRLKYYFDPMPLPDANNETDLATMWKKVYNTALGKGDIKRGILAFKSAIREFPFHG